MFLSGCGGTPVIDNPAVELDNPANRGIRHRAALDVIRTRDMTEDELRVVRGMLHRDGYTVEIREEALLILEEREPELLHQTIDFHLPRIEARQWRTRLCEIVAERQWRDLTPALVRAWAWPLPGWRGTMYERPEYLALRELHGEAGVMDAVYDILVREDSVAFQGLRSACWFLLHDLGERDRLISLLNDTNVAPHDGFLADLRAAAVELGIVAANREEILWIRKLREPEREAFWTDAAAIVDRLPVERREGLELRDLAVLRAVARHEPELLEMDEATLYAMVDAHVHDQEHHHPGQDASGFSTRVRSMLADHRDDLTWGDLVAMLMVARSVRVPEVASHLFDYAERDRIDESTEYGGVIDLDERSRFEVLEFQPRIRGSDREFNATQEMFDAGYTAIFHFHLHAQEYRNGRFAGPGSGDDRYAETTRANCLVFTFIDRDTLNVDFYRHGELIVDLGDITRPE
jgi:hypothetical protein